MKKIALYAAAFFALAAEPAHAGFVTAVVGWLGSLSFASGIAGALARIALGIGFNLLSTAIAKKFAKRQSIDVKFDVEIGDDRSLSFTAGFFATAGKRKFIGSWGPNTRFITEVIEVSCLPQPGQPGLWVNDTHAEIDWNSTGAHSETVITGYTTYTTDNGNTRRRPIYARKTVTMGHPVTNYAGGVQRIWVKWVAGPTEADPFLVDVFGDDPDYPWTAEMIGTGKSYLIVTTQYDSDVITSYPQYLIEPPPLPVYDPRKDSTVGGLGPHRWGDRSTYEASTNPAVIAYNIARGIYLGDEWIFGGRNLSAWRLPLAEWIAAMNACDEEVELAEGGTEPAYRCGAEISVDMEPLGVLEEIGRAANMRFAEVGGRLKPIVGLPGASVYTITDADIIITEGQSLTPFLPEAQTYNALTATYPEPGEKWASKPAPEYVDAEATAADDGDYLPVGATYGAAPFAQQVQRLMRAQMRDYRRMIIAQFQLPPEAFGLEPLVDMITWNSDRNGFSGKRFVVEQVVKLPGMNVAVTLREVDPGDYDWSPAWEQPVVISPPVNVIPVVLEPEDFAAVGVAVQSQDGRDRLPGIQCSCAGGLSGVAAVRIQVRKIAAAEPMLDVERPYAAPHEWVVTGVAPETTYFVRLALVSDFGVPAEWSDEIEVVTPQILIDFPDLAPDVEGAMEDALAAAALAEAAEAGAQAAQTASETARNLSQAAATAAADARDAANSAAALALASETAASGSATAAATAKTASEAAKTAAETARNQAQTHATNAGASATAAAGSAATASTKATEAGNSATAAQASVVAAEAAHTATVGVAVAALPSDFASHLYWKTAWTGSPETAAVPESDIVDDADFGKAYSKTWTAIGNSVNTRGVIKPAAERVYRITARFKVVSTNDGQPVVIRINARTLDASYAQVAALTNGSTSYAPGSTIHELSWTYSSAAGAGVNSVMPTLATAPWARFGVYCGEAGRSAQVLIGSVKVEDVTESRAAGMSASAAATSASSAAASATDAEDSASAASTAATTATTKAGEASTSATNAANSASTATTKANEASSSATVAATQAGNAGVSASAASGSATTAATKATEASNSATAAAGSATTASTKAGEASTSATQAATAKEDAQSAAATATTQAGIAVSAKLAASNAAAASFPEDFSQKGAFWVRNEPAGFDPAPVPDSYFRTSAIGGEPVFWASGFHVLGPRAFLPGVAGRRYEVTVKFRVTVNSTVTGGTKERAVLGFRGHAADGAGLAVYVGSAYRDTCRVADGVMTLTTAYTVPASPSFALLRPRFYLGYDASGSGNATYEVISYAVRDVTESTSAAASATAAGTSETNAAASATTAGAQATIATTKATEASTSAGTASTKAGEASSSASDAAGSANTAAIHAGAAAGSATTAGNHATAAAGSAATATTKAGEAGQYSAEAMEYRDTAARLMSGGVSKNPIFSVWSSTYPEHVACAPLGAGTITKITSGARYINAIEVDANVSSVNGPLVRLERVAHGLDCSLSPRAVLARMEIEYLSGDLPGSGSFLRGYWQDTAARVVDRPLKDLITATPGVVQAVETYIERPADAVPGSAADFMLVFYGHTTLHGGTRAPLKVRIHRLDFEEVLAGSATETWQRAAVDFQGVQSAVVGFRAEAGSAGASMELVALDDPNGAALSGVTINGQYIRLNGDTVVDGDFEVTGDMIVGGRLTREFLSAGIHTGAVITASGTAGAWTPASEQVAVDFYSHDTANSAVLFGAIYMTFSTSSDFKGRVNVAFRRKLAGVWATLGSTTSYYYLPAGTAGEPHSASFGPVLLAGLADNIESWEEIGLTVWLQDYSPTNHATNLSVNRINWRVWQTVGRAS